MLIYLLDSFKDNPCYSYIQNFRQFDKIGGVLEQSKGLLLSLLVHNSQSPIIWITSSLDRAERVNEEASFFSKKLPQKIIHFPEREENNSSIGERICILDEILAEANIKKTGIVTSIKAILQPTLGKNTLNAQKINLSKEKTIDPEILIKKLINFGYQRAELATSPGEFARRGYILDIFSPQKYPVRIEFFGQTIESIRNFKPSTQISFDGLDDFTLLPINEGKKHHNLIDQLPEETIVILDEPESIKIHTREFLDDALKKTYMELGKKIKNKTTIKIYGNLVEEKSVFNFTASPVNPFKGNMENFVQDLKKWQGEDMATAVITLQDIRLSEILQNYSVAGVSYLQPKPLTGRNILITHGHLEKGFYLRDYNLILISDLELFGSITRRNIPVTIERAEKNQLEKFKPQDFVIHTSYGVAQFQKLLSLEVQGTSGDYLLLEFSKGDKLYLPVSQLNLLQKYIASEGTTPKLSNLRGTSFKNLKRKIKESVKEIAKKLLHLYASRASISGYPFPADTIWQAELEASFPYEETQDQIKAIKEVKKDMECPKAMDRLVCGDAGYGKTEVALRASFKAAINSKQVAMLVPTTVLAQQHYQTFKERLSAYPVKVEVLSRFKSKKEQKEIVENLKEGKIDIIIGTHRLLQKDIEFKTLGLVIIDEEQHFGVSDKEKLKELKGNVDTLTLTATPIPRTFQMSLLGIRDMSLINTPPEERIPVKTYVHEFSPRVIKSAILKELERGGQVFFINNRILGIEKIANEILRLIPGAKLAIAHGRLDEEKLEEIMLNFYGGEIDILVCTTIIESGIDIPKANTIIVNNAHLFGLAQLYQIRGRVGRSHLQAHAHLLYPPKKIKPAGEERLKTLREFTELGSGFQIALKDLEIRGAGNLLGTEQHGYISSVGFTLYCQLLNQAIEELKGKKTEEEYSPSIELPIPAYLPLDYIGGEEEKLNIYKRLGDIKSEKKLEGIKEEMLDRFGKYPEEVENLFKIIKLKILCLQYKILSIKYYMGKLTITAPLLIGLDIEFIGKTNRDYGIEISYGNKQVIIKKLAQKKEWFDTLINLIASLGKYTPKKT